MDVELGLRKKEVMAVEKFIETIVHEVPPEGISNNLLALWYAQKGGWYEGHNIAQDIGSGLGSWIHNI